MTKISSPKAPRAAKTKAVAATPALVLNHAEMLDGGDIALNDLIASLHTPESDEVFEPAVTTTAAETDLSMLDAAVSGAEAVEAMISAATPSGVTEAGAEPTGDASDVVADAAVTDVKVKKVSVPRKRYTDKTERLKDKLGDGLAEYSVLTLADAGVTEEELAGVMEGTMVVIRAMSGKAQNWAVKFIEYMAGKKASLSEVTARVLRLLHKDGFITTGNEGNLFKDLVSKPYSPGAARAMGGNNLAMLMHLKVIQADGKGRFIANPDSLLLMKVNSMLFADSAEADEEAAELSAGAVEPGEAVETAGEEVTA